MSDANPTGNPLPQNVQDTVNTPPANPSAQAATSELAGTQPPQQQPAAQVTSPPPAQAVPNNPKANIFHGILSVLGGGPKVTYTMDDNGQLQKNTADRSNADLGKLVLAHALTGLFAGAEEHGPGAALKSMGAGGQAVTRQMKAQDEENKAWGQQQWQNQQQTVLRKAQIAETNSHTVLNTANAERLGIDAIEKQMELGSMVIDKARTEGTLQGEHVTQAQWAEGLRNGKYNATMQMGPVDGYVMIPSSDGKLRPETTHAVVGDGDTTLTQEDYDKFKAAHVPGFDNAKVAPGASVKISSLNMWAQQAGAVTNTRDSIAQIHSKLRGTDAEKTLPNVDQVIQEPGVATALVKFQKYLYQAGGDPAAAIQLMSAQTHLDPKTGQAKPNPDYQFAPLALKAFGGWGVVNAYHNALLTERKAAEEKPQQDFQRKQQATELANAETKAQSTARGTAKGQIEGQLAAIGGGNLSGSDYLKTLPPSRSNFIQGVYEGRMELTAQMLRTKDGQLLAQQIMQAYPGFDMSRAPAYFATRKAFSSGKEARGMNTLNTALSHIGHLYDVTTFSATFPGVSGAARVIGGHDAKAFEYYKKKVGEEIQQAYVQGALTNMDKEEADKQLREWLPSNAREGERALTTLLVSKLRSYQTQWENAKPSTAIPDFPVISQANVGVIKKITGEDVGGITSQASRTTQPVTHTGTVPVGARPIMRNGAAVGYIQNGQRTDF